MRAKDNRFKITISDLEVVSTLDLTEKKPLVELYKRRGSKDGIPTQNYEAIKKIKAILAKQILEIKDHVSYVRSNDTYENSLIKAMLSDDNW